MLGYPLCGIVRRQRERWDVDLLVSSVSWRVDLGYEMADVAPDTIGIHGREDRFHGFGFG